MKSWNISGTFLEYLFASFLRFPVHALKGQQDFFQPKLGYIECLAVL
jgi:hypothetical protein